MKQKRLSVNILYNIISQIAGVVAPLIISPYISRVFDANLIGDYGYTLANSSYFVLLEGLGLTLYGMIQISKVRDNKEARNQIFWEIFWLRVIMLLVCSIAYAIFVLFFAERQLMTLYWIMLLNILGSGLDTTWFLSGLEEFKVVAIRTVVVRAINILLVLLLVRQKEDIYKYALIMQGSAFVSFVTIIPISLRQVNKISFRSLKVFRHLKPSIAYFVPGLVNTVFSSADKSVLGAFSKNSYEVGVYEQANKICQLCAGSINAVSNAILPRITYMFANAKDEGVVKEYVQKTVRIALLFSMPITVGIAMVSDSFVPWFFGEGYEKSALLLKILCINVFFTSVGNFISQQCLIARGKQKEYNIAIIIGASLNLILNIILVNRYMSIGVSVASALTGIIVFLAVLYAARDVINAKDIVIVGWKYCVAAIIMAFTVKFLPEMPSLTLQLGIQILGGIIVYCLVLMLLRDKAIQTLLHRKET